MPNIRRRVNSLLQECEKNTQMNHKNDCADLFLNHLVINWPLKQNWVCGQFGLGDPQQLLAFKQCLKLDINPMSVNIKIFESDMSALTRFITQLGALTTQDSNDAHFITALLQANPVAISGCQRFIFDDGKFILDLYLGEPLHCLKQIHCPSNSNALIDFWTVTLNVQALNEAILWQMARLSQDNAQIYSLHHSVNDTLSDLARKTGFAFFVKSSNSVSYTEAYSPTTLSTIDSQVLAQERKALRQAHRQKTQYNPLNPAMINHSTGADTIAIIGGGLASAHLTLSLAQRRQKIHLFCSDSTLAQQASGNKQGAIYPLLTPDNGHLSHYFQQGYLFSRRRLQSLVDDGFTINYDFCGVLQTGFDERSSTRLNKIITSQTWNEQIASAISSEDSSKVAGIDIDKAGIYYPLGGWINPHEFTQAAFDKATQLSDVTAEFTCQIVRIERVVDQWYIYKIDSNSHQEITFGPFNTLVLANGPGLTQFKQSEQLAITGFRGQVSHIPTQDSLLKLNTVLCSHGYFTPQHNGFHCTGASYVKNPQHLDYCPNEQLENLQKVTQSYAHKAWTEDVDISDNHARIGVRMVTRDHAPMMGCTPDIDDILVHYQEHQHTKESIKYWQETPAPIHQGLYVLGGLGSRGITSGPLAAEALAAQLCGEIIPLDGPTLEMLNPNRMWMRKLIKGKAL
ncbi:FAD-dependent 5-carboxymethylaminomethyl-2-thiouridine(34) oxidoreductase MnmC [Shewanella sp. VB17]|uniref:FAD-dependent 5-carboxymethylaminomethyl-2-thiouridine(34) oxidoreductase MnmC n=1 Tax=Shewanella sp. VB17 TaxID=2739432 RepID=UPI001564F80D|nr:FAD-dependent 5-carboxymethylaminomethyl-2-thiouridine(34) oxidoreductase MnmC [Shewanella sp. VB17]NRD74361.1 FAD-dependent 5-carboxymethylaminomethyl-2-thiouridine(34) oxidoreductase MnmC [Shewanella sp. VB17]